MRVRKFHTAFLCGSFSIFPSHAAEKEIPVLSVCEALSDIGKYDGQSVIVVGRLVGTIEGAWLDAECGFKVLNAGREFRPSISLSYVVGWVEPPLLLPARFRWDKRLIKGKLDEIKRTTQLQVLKQYHYRDRWFAIFGRLETKLPAKLNLGGGGVDIIGFGHLNGSPAQLISPKNGYLHLRGR